MVISLVSEKVVEFYNNGMRMLKVMFFMFDFGIGIFYDLRYIIAGLASNRVRWDYYKVYIK